MTQPIDNKIEEIFFQKLRGKTVTKEQAYILKWAEKRLKPAIKQLLSEQDKVSRIDELSALHTEEIKLFGIKTYEYAGDRINQLKEGK